MGGEFDYAGVVMAIASAAGLIVVHLRTRKDVNVTEMEKRIDKLEKRAEHSEQENGRLRSELVRATRRIFRLERTLARNGIPDPDSEPEDR